MNLLSQVKILRALNAQSTATAATTGRAIDTAGFEGCLFVVTCSSLMAGTTGKIKVKTAASTTGTFVAANTVGTAALASASFNKKIMAIDVYRPLNRYLRCCITNATSGTVRSITALLYGARRPGSSALESTQVGTRTIVVAATS